ncbi:MAG: ECF transporter S component [Lachnospiraceae bacterium]
MEKWLETLGKLGTAFVENFGFVLLSVAIVAVIIIAAKFAEKAADKKHGTEKTKQLQKTRRMVIIAMLSAIAIVLMMFDFPLPFLPGFYKIDASELPVIIGAFTLGPVAGVVIEFIKVMINLLTTGTATAFVGEFANFLIGCAFVVPASMVYYFKKTKKQAVIGLLLGLVICTVSGCLLNAFLLLPAYGKAFHMEVSALVAMGTAVNGMIDSLLTFVIFATAPLNIIKCAVVSILTLLIYKPISKLLKG